MTKPNHFSSNLKPLGTIEFQRKTRSDKGKKRGSYKERLAQAGELTGNAAKYGAALVAGDKIFSTAKNAAGETAKGVRKGAASLAKKAGKRKLARSILRKSNPNSVIGKSKGAAKLVGGLVAGDVALRGVNKVLGTAFKNKHKIEDRRKRR